MESPELSNTPVLNMAPDATVCTVGMATPSAQGQVMIRTATGRNNGIVPGCTHHNPANHGQ